MDNQIITSMDNQIITSYELHNFDYAYGYNKPCIRFTIAGNERQFLEWLNKGELEVVDSTLDEQLIEEAAFMPVVTLEEVRAELTTILATI